MMSATSICRPTCASNARGYTLVELFLTVGVLMCVLGLAVNLANRQRQESLDRMARRQLQQLSAVMARYVADHTGRLPDVTPLMDPASGAPALPPTSSAGPVPALDSADLRERAIRNAQDVRRALNWAPSPEPAADPLIDPWGTPIVFMAHQSPLVGMAPGDRPFFVSAGPDRQFGARADNLYSYDYADVGPDAAAANPMPGSAHP